jgi:hypothetical protein
MEPQVLGVLCRWHLPGELPYIGLTQTPLPPYYQTSPVQITTYFRGSHKKSNSPLCSTSYQYL